jgi:hypothetical protein
MEKGAGISPSSGIYRRLIRWWLALSGRKIRMLQAAGVGGEGSALFAVSHPAGFLPALVLVTSLERPVRCLLPENLTRGPLARFLARRLGIILYPGDRPISEAILRKAIDVLASGGALAVFADQGAPGQGASGKLATTAATLVWRAEAQHLGRRVAVHPVHLFLPESAASSREILIYVDSVLNRPTETLSQGAVTPAFIAALEARFQENAFQLRPADVEYFLSDLEEVLRAGLQENWESRTDWKQDAEGFALSRSVTEWVKQTNSLHPSQLVALRKSLDDYRRLLRECALRQLEVGGGESPLGTGWRKVLLWFETLLGLPIALYGLVNHLAIGLVLFLAGSLKRNSSRTPTTQWTIRIAVTVGFYVLQIFLMAHYRGRAAAGYYAPTLPVSGLYLWRYLGLVRPQAHLLFVSLTIPGLKRKIKSLRHALQEELDRMLESSQSSVGSRQ